MGSGIDSKSELNYHVLTVDFNISKRFVDQLKERQRLEEDHVRGVTSYKIAVHAKWNTTATGKPCPFKSIFYTFTKHPNKRKASLFLAEHAGICRLRLNRQKRCAIEDKTEW
jgi:hypothetical protein